MRRASLLALLVALAAPGAAAGSVRQFEQPAREGVQRAQRRFDMIGLRAAVGMREKDAYARVRKHGGEWSRWFELDPGVDTGTPRATQPVWTGGSDEIQLRTRRHLRGLRVVLLRVPHRARPRARRAQSVGPGDAPAIVPREQWAGEDCDPRGTPSYGRVQLAFVHHTVSANDYSPEESAAMVLGICRYHRNTLGWNDIGYNFVVDQYGTIFEGRAGGIDRAVIGAHAQGWNSESTGVATLGTYSTVPLSDPSLRAIAQLLAWKLPLHGAPTQGTVQVASGGGEANRYPKGTVVEFPRIAGHRDGDKTDCPGDQLYAQLQRLRELVGFRVPAPGTAPAGARSPLALTAAPTEPLITYPQYAPVLGRLADTTGAGVGGAPVRLEFRGSDGRYRPLVSTTTAPDGSWEARVPTAFSRTLRASYPGDAGRMPATSRAFAIAVAPSLALRRTHSRLPAGRRIDLRGTLRPAKQNATVTVAVERRGAAGYVRARTVRAHPRRFAFRVLYRALRPGLYRFTARSAADKTNAAGASAPAFIRVTHTAATRVGAAAAR